MTGPESGRVGRPKGLPKTGGRRAGTPNKTTVLLREKLSGLGYDPITELIKIARDPNTPVEVQVNIHQGIVPYLYGKRKPVDESNQEPMTVNVNTILEVAGEAHNAGVDAQPET
jgi:hypothetical protein